MAIELAGQFRRNPGPEPGAYHINLPLTTTVPAGTLELVMEVLSPDQTAEHNFFIVGSNPDLETGLSYLSAPDCGNPVPSPVECFLGPMHYVFNIDAATPPNTSKIVISIPIGSAIAAVWSYGFSKSGNLLSPL